MVVSGDFNVISQKAHQSRASRTRAGLAHSVGIRYCLATGEPVGPRRRAGRHDTRPPVTTCSRREPRRRPERDPRLARDRRVDATTLTVVLKKAEISSYGRTPICYLFSRARIQSKTEPTPQKRCTLRGGRIRAPKVAQPFGGRVRARDVPVGRKQ
ncbi:hypothetical protein EVAR_57362_1 [Eumeta japonica]|uniref:Uncharacterized protein n=1 Tax=Eumeta variegata TaxID=151549 RepID=A0A4C1ZBT7_EUMVA|nr:hypothetical protein EVAR_57362_1 [Eumeta japonica]